MCGQSFPSPYVAKPRVHVPPSALFITFSPSNSRVFWHSVRHLRSCSYNFLWIAYNASTTTDRPAVPCGSSPRLHLRALLSLIVSTDGERLRLCPPPFLSSVPHPYLLFERVRSAPISPSSITISRFGILGYRLLLITPFVGCCDPSHSYLHVGSSHYLRISGRSYRLQF